MSRVARILNTTKGSPACERARLADGPFSRLRGLLGRSGLQPGEGLLLTPAPAIHTAFMRFAIDAVFLDADLRVLRVAERLGSWKSAAKRHARSVLELGAGEAARLGIAEGDQLQIVPDRPQAVSANATGAQSAAEEPPTVGAAVSGEQLVAYRQTVRALPTREGAGTAPGEERAQPMRVMVVSSDRRFREVVSLLLGRRGCKVSVGDGSPTLSERVDREHTDVVVIDAGRSLATAARIAAAVESLTLTVGIVIVNDQHEPMLPKLQTLPKWGAFEELFAAVEHAHAQRDRPGLFEETASGAPS